MKRAWIGVAIALVTTISLQAETIAITGGTVHTMGPQGTIENGTVVIVDGRISAVGAELPVPAGARRIDASGKVITPGLFNSLTTLGIVEVSAVPESSDESVQDDRITAGFDVVDAINPQSTLIPVNRIDGLTRAVVAPDPGKSVIAGQGAVIHLGNGSQLVVREKVATFASLGEKGAELSGGSRGAAMLRLREALQDALDFSRNRQAFDEGSRRPYALSRLDIESLIPVIRGERPLVVRVQRASDILSVLRLQKEFSLKVILAGADEGWRVAREIAAAGVPVLVNPLDDLPISFEKLGATLENSARLQKAGVAIAFMTDDAHNARNVRQGAGNAVAHGMPWDAALASLTSVPARIWGISGTYGTLEAGKDADVVIWSGDPLELTSYPDAVFIRGAQMPMISRQTELRDRYKDLAAAPPR